MCFCITESFCGGCVSSLFTTDVATADATATFATGGGARFFEDATLTSLGGTGDGADIGSAGFGNGLTYFIHFSRI